MKHLPVIIVFTEQQEETFFTLIMYTIEKY